MSPWMSTFALWVPLVAAAQDPVPSPPELREQPEARDGIGVLVGLAVGPAVPVSGLGTHFVPRLEAGIELPPLGRRLRLVTTAQASRPVQLGAGSATTTSDGTYTWTLRESYWMVGAGPVVALRPGAERFNVELAVVPQLLHLVSRVTGTGGEGEIGETVEKEWRLATRLGAGARYAVGPGELTGALEAELAGFSGRVPGDAPATLIVPRVGYRLVW